MHCRWSVIKTSFRFRDARNASLSFDESSEARVSRSIDDPDGEIFPRDPEGRVPRRGSRDAGLAVTPFVIYRWLAGRSARRRFPGITIVGHLSWVILSKERAVARTVSLAVGEKTVAVRSRAVSELRDLRLPFDSSDTTRGASPIGSSADLCRGHCSAPHRTAVAGVKYCPSLKVQTRIALATATACPRATAIGQ